MDVNESLIFTPIENGHYYWSIRAVEGYGTCQISMVQSGNVAPNAPTNPSPAHGVTGVSTNQTLSVDVSDPDGDSMDVSFYNASDDSLIGTDTGISSGGTAFTNWFGLSEGIMYSWYAIADDGTALTLSANWSFTTDNAPNILPNPSPADEATGISLNPTLGINVTDLDGDLMDVSFYDASDDSLIGTDTGISSGGTASITWFGLSEGITYSWYVKVNDSVISNISSTWSFTVFIDSPVWTQNPTDQTIECGDPFRYDLNASDLSGIASWWINDTTYFIIDANGVITNAFDILVGEYWLDVRAYDPYSNFCNATIKITVKDTLSPAITIIYPTSNQMFKDRAPTFNLSVIDVNLDEIWYTLDDGTINITCGASGQINQDLWNVLYPGTYTLRFYANDTSGNEGFSEIIIRKEDALIFGYNFILITLISIIGIGSLTWQIRKKIKI